MRGHCGEEEQALERLLFLVLITLGFSFLFFFKLNCELSRTIFFPLDALIGTPASSEKAMCLTALLEP